MNKIPYDKKLHFICGFIIMVLCSLISALLQFMNYSLTFMDSFYVGLIMSIIAGIVKEIYDYNDYGSFDYKDMISTWLGGLFGFVILYVVFIKL